MSGLRAVAERHEAIGDVRGQGLFIGVVLVRDRATREPATDLAGTLVEAALDRGILLSTDGPAHDTLKIKPPLVIESSEIDRVVETLGVLLTELGSDES